MLTNIWQQKRTILLACAALLVVVAVAVAARGSGDNNQATLAAGNSPAASSRHASSATPPGDESALKGVDVDALKTKLQDAVASLGDSTPQSARIVQTQNGAMQTAMGMMQEPRSTERVIIVEITGKFAMPGRPEAPQGTTLVEMYKVPSLEPAGLIVGSGPGAYGDLSRFGPVTTLDISSSNTVR